MKTKLIKLEQWFNNRFAWFFTNGNKAKTKSTNQVSSNDNASDLYSYVFWYNVYKSTWYAIPRNVYAEFFSGNYDAAGVLKSNKLDTLLTIIEKNIVVN